MNLYNVLDTLKELAITNETADFSDAINSAETTQNPLSASLEEDANAQKEADQIIADIVATGDPYLLYGLVSSHGNTPGETVAITKIQELYDDVVVSMGLHPDDDFEQIYDIVLDRLEDASPVAEADTDAIEDSDQLNDTPGDVHQEYNAYINLHEGKEKERAMLSEDIMATAAVDGTLTINATQGSPADEAESISSVLRNAGLTPSGTSDTSPMGIAPASTGYTPAEFDEPEDSLEDPLNGPTEFEPDTAANTPDIENGIDDFGVDYNIATADVFGADDIDTDDISFDAPNEIDDPAIDVVTDPVDPDMQESASDFYDPEAGKQAAYDAGYELAQRGGHITDVNVSDEWGPDSGEFTTGYHAAKSGEEKLEEKSTCSTCGGTGYCDDDDGERTECTDCNNTFDESLDIITTLAGKQVDEWANSTENDSEARGDYQDTEFMVNTNSGGLNNQKNPANANKYNKGDNAMSKLQQESTQLENELIRAFKAFK